MTVLVFDIETVPDISSGRNLYNLHDLKDDADVAQAGVRYHQGAQCRFAGTLYRHHRPRWRPAHGHHWYSDDDSGHSPSHMNRGEVLQH